MSRYRRFPFTGVNKYISHFLETEGVLPSTINIKGVDSPTLIPATETPEIQGSNVPGYLVYALGLDQHEKRVESKCEEMSYTIYSNQVGKVHEILYALQDLFSNQDWSAGYLNAFLESQGSRDFHYLTTDFEIITGPIRLDDEGGRYSAIVDVHYEYVQPIKGTPGPDQGMRS